MTSVKCNRVLSPERNRDYLDAMRLVESLSGWLDTTSWIWGGFATDIYAGRILRDHDDLDYLTLNLCQHRERLAQAFSSHGWQTSIVANGDLKLRKGAVKIELGNVEIETVATWTHNGEKGSLCFPAAWLDLQVIEFCGIEVHVVASELQYVLKEHPELLNPGWRLREKDLLDRKYLEEILVKKGIDVYWLYKSVASA
jgi:hypothetical protein